MGDTQLKISKDSKPMPNQTIKMWQTKHTKMRQCKHVVISQNNLFLYEEFNSCNDGYECH